MSYTYLRDEIPWDEYYMLLAVALDIDEREQYRQYVLAGGDPRKFKWSSYDKAGTEPSSSPQSFWTKVAAQMGHGLKSDIAYAVEGLGLEPIVKITETMSDGSTRVRYETQDGRDITKEVEAQIKANESIFISSKVAKAE